MDIQGAWPTLVWLAICMYEQEFLFQENKYVCTVGMKLQIEVGYYSRGACKGRVNRPVAHKQKYFDELLD